MAAAADLPFTWWRLPVSCLYGCWTGPHRRSNLNLMTALFMYRWELCSDDRCCVVAVRKCPWKQALVETSPCSMEKRGIRNARRYDTFTTR